MMENGKLKLNTDDMSFGDFEDFEEYTGRTIEEAFKQVFDLDEQGNKQFDDRGKPQMKMNYRAKDLVGIVWIVGRQSNASFTLDDARKVKLNEIEFGSTPDPKESEERSA